MDQLKISIIIPVFNEEKTIGKVIDSLLMNVQSLHEIILVDDGSTDKTAEICSAYQNKNKLIRYFLQPSNQGKTSALKTGFSNSTGDIVIVQDADLEYDPADINKVVGPIQSDQADVVYGSRFSQPGASQAFYLRSLVANRVLTFLSNLFTGMKLSDVETCYKAFRGEIIRDMIITAQGFGFEIEVTAKLAKLGCRITELPISYNGRSYSEGKKIRWQDGAMALFYILKYNIFESKSKSFHHPEELTFPR